MTDMPRRWTALPVEIEAEQWTGHLEDLPEEWLDPNLELLYLDSKGRLLIRTQDGLARPRVGDWIVRGITGEMYPIRRLIFEAKYRPAGVTPAQSNGDRAPEDEAWTPEQVAAWYAAEYPRLPRVTAKRIRQLVRDGVIPHRRGERQSIWLTQASKDALLTHGRQGGT